MPILFTAKNRELFKSEIERSIAPKIMKLIDKVDGRVDNLEDKVQLMEVKVESLAAEYNGRPTTRNSRKTPSPKPKQKSVRFRILNSPPTRTPPSPPHGGQRKKNKTRKFRKSSH